MFCRHFRSVCNRQMKCCIVLPQFQPFCVCVYEEWKIIQKYNWTRGSRATIVWGSTWYRVSTPCWKPSKLLTNVAWYRSETTFFVLPQFQPFCVGVNEEWKIIQNIYSRFMGDDCWWQRMLPCQYAVLETVKNEMLHYIIRKPLSLSCCHSFNRFMSV